MTTWNISAVWYPLWAFIVFLLVVTAAYVGGKISIENENGKYSLSDFRWDSGSNHGKDAESPNQRRLRRSTSIGSVIMGPTAVVSTKIPYEVDEDLPQRWDSYRRKARGSRRAKRLSLRERGASGGIPQSGVHEVYNPPVPVQTLSPETEKAPHEEAAEYSSASHNRHRPTHPCVSSRGRHRQAEVPAEIDRIPSVRAPFKQASPSHIAPMKSWIRMRAL